MAVLDRFMDRSSIVLLITTTLACVTKIISTAIVTHLATSTLSSGPNFAIAAAASALELLGLFALIASIGLFLRRVSRRLLLIALTPGAALGVVGTTLSVVVLALTLTLAESSYKDRALYSSTHDLCAAGLAIAALGVVPQTAFYILILPLSNEASTVEATTFTTSKRSPTFPTDKQCPKSINLESLDASPPRSATPPLAPMSPYLSTAPSSRSSSLKRSLSNSLHPVTSRTRLLLGSGSGSGFVSRDSRSIHSGVESVTSPIRGINNDFENWDTSAVEGQYDNSGPQRKPLETIPGSRPVSPACALNGPFADDERSPEETPLPDSPSKPRHLPASDDGSMKAHGKLSTRKNSAPDELHIHPLFRSESPVPPPLKSPNTVITGSPFAGQVVSPELVSPRILHSAQSSRPASPCRLNVQSRSGSIRSLRTLPTSPLEADPRGRSQLSEAYLPSPYDDRGEVWDVEPARS